MLIRAIALLLLVGTLHAQEPAPMVPDGTLIRAKVKNRCSTKSVKAGDEIVLNVIDDIRAPSGQTIIPKKTRLIGHVRAVQAFKKDQADSRLFFVVEYAELKGARLNLNARVDSLELLRSMVTEYWVEKPTHIVPGIGNLDPDSPRAGVTYSPPEGLKSRERPGYPLSHVAFMSSNGSVRKDMLFSRTRDIELTPQDAIIVLKQSAE
jgi:hypothetical protein